MARRRDPNFLTGHLCRFCGQPVPWGTILRLLRVDPDQPPYMQKESLTRRTGGGNPSMGLWPHPLHFDCLAAVSTSRLF